MSKTGMNDALEAVKKVIKENGGTVNHATLEAKLQAGGHWQSLMNLDKILSSGAIRVEVVAVAGATAEARYSVA